MQRGTGARRGQCVRGCLPESARVDEGHPECVLGVGRQVRPGVRAWCERVWQVELCGATSTDHQTPPRTPCPLRAHPWTLTRIHGRPGAPDTVTSLPTPLAPLKSQCYRKTSVRRTVQRRSGQHAPGEPRPHLSIAAVMGLSPLPAGETASPAPRARRLSGPFSLSAAAARGHVGPEEVLPEVRMMVPDEIRSPFIVKK